MQGMSKLPGTGFWEGHRLSLWCRQTHAASRYANAVPGAGKAGPEPGALPRATKLESEPLSAVAPKSRAECSGLLVQSDLDVGPAPPCEGSLCASTLLSGIGQPLVQLSVPARPLST
jgi:hypothetical protein